MENRYQRAFGNPPKIYKELPKLKTDPIIKWLKEKIFTERYIFFNRSKNEAICSNCGPVHMPDDVKHNEWGTCPKCHRKVQYKSAGIGRGKLEGRARILIFQRKGKSVYATSNFIYADYSEGRVKLYKDIDGVFKFNRKVQEGYKTSYGYFYGGGWGKQTNIRIPYRTGKWKNVPVYVYKENIKEAFKNTDLKYCELAEQVYKWYPETFLKLVDLNAKYESVEKIHKVGLDDLIKSKLLNEHGSGAIKWKKNNLKDILGLSKDELYYARQAKISMSTLEKYKKATKIGMNLSFEEAKKIYLETLQIIWNAREYIKPLKLYRYLEKQAKDSTIGAINLMAKDYKDYIKECSTLRLDLKDKRILLPRDLLEAHARTSTQIRVTANKAQNEMIKKNTKKMRIFNFKEENLLIRIAETSEEIILEGKLMGHCVGGYVERVAEGRTNIFFVRKVAEPNEPYYTLELKKKNGKYEMIQCRGGGRGEGNGDMTEEVEMFVDKWMAEVVEAKQNKRKKVA